MAGSKNKSWLYRLQNGIRDVFDANTEDDQIRRQQAGQPRYYQQQQAQQKNPTVRYGTNPVSQAVNRARDYVDANTAQDRAARLAQGRKELEQRTFQAKYAPFLKPAKQVWNVSTANPIMNPIGFAMKASEPIKPVHNLVGGVEQGVSRSLVGTAQSTAGLVDLLSPGTGQSTATKFLNKTAEGIDQNVKDKGYNNITYKGAQAATDVGTFLVPGAGASKIASATGKVGKFVPGGSKAYNSIIKAMDTASKTLDDSGKIGQVTNKVGKFYLKPENAIDIGVDTGLNAGFRSARGEDNSLSTFGQDFGLSTAFSGGIGLGALGAKKAVTKLFKEKDIKQIAKSTDVNEIRNALEMRYPNLNSYELDRMAGDLVNKTTKKEVKGALEEAVVKDTAKGATLENTSETPTADVTQPTEGPTRLSDTNTVEGPTRLSDTNLTQTPAQATATIKQRYPQLDETKAAELDTRLNLAKTPEEKAIIELEAKARNDAIQAEVKQATSPQTVAPSQQAIEADTQVMADNTANVAPQAIKAPGEPNTKTMQDLQQLGVSQQDLENAQLPEIKQNPVLTGLIKATEDLKKEGIPESAIDRAMKDPNAPSDPAEFKNFVRRIANTQTQSNDVLEVQRAMMEAYNRGDIETANMLNDSLRESGNNPLANNFPSPTNQVNPTPPINKQTNTANSTPAKTTVEVDSLYDGGKSSKDGSDLYGTPDGYKYTVEMPSQKDVETVRTKRAEYNANGSGFSSTKSDIVVKDEDGDVVRIIDYDKAVEKYGATDPEKLANLAANQGVEPATPKPVAPKGVAPKSVPIENPKAPEPSLATNNTEQKLGYVKKLSVEREMLLAQLDSKNGRMYGNQYTEIANRLDEIDQEINDYLYNAKPTPIKASDTPQAAPIEKTPTMSPEEEASLFNTRSAPETPTTNQVTGEVPFGKPEINNNPIQANIEEPIIAKPENVPEGVDPVTGEIKQAPAKDLIDVYNEAPASGSGIESAEKFINDVGASADAHINNLKADLEANGHTYQEFHDVIQQADRNGTTPPDWAQSTYGKYIRPYVDRAAEFGGKVDKAQIEAHPWYLPQRKPTQSGDELFTGDTMIDILDIGDSGFSKTRENKIPLGSLDNSTDPLKSYFVKNASLQHTDDLQVKKLMEANPNMSKEQATTYVGKKKEQINKLAADAEEGGMFSSQVEKNNYADETRAIGKETGAKTITIDNKHGRAYNFFSSSNEFQGDVKFTDTDGVVRSVKEASGTHLYNNAGAYGDTVAREAYKSGKLSPKTVKEGLAAHTTSTKITQSQIDEIGDKAVKDLRNYDDQLAFNKKNGVAEPSKREVDEIRQYIMARAHRKLARVQIDNFFAEADFTGNMALKRNLERDAKDILLYDSTANSLADKTANAIRGTIYRGFLGYNPVSALQNVTELRRAYGLFGEKGFAVAGKKALADLDIVQRYGLTESVHKKKSYSQQAKDGSSSSRITKKDLLKPMGGFNATEEFKDAVLLHGLEAKVRKEQPGLNALDFKKAVLDEFDQVGFKGGRKGSLGFNKQKVMGTVLQFMQYSVKDWKYTASKIGQAVKGDRQAQKYLARKGAADVATYFALSYAIGATAESVFNFRNPASEDYRTKDAPLDVKGLSYARNLTGAGGGLMIDAYSAYRMNQEAAKSEDKQADTTANVMKNQAIKDAAILVPGGNQIFNKTGGFITDMRRGYNENSSGLARFGVPKVNTDEGAKKTAQNVFGVAKGLVLGKYQTDQAKEYFGSNKIASDVREKFGGAGQAHNPVSQRYQDEITKNSNQDQNPAAMMSRFQMKQGSVGDKLKAAFGSNTKDTAKIDATINAARGAQDLKKNFALDSPEANDLYKTLYDTKKLPNGKIETNTISKERWSKLGSNDAKTEKSIEFLRQKAIKNNKDFGDPIDPVFDLNPNQRREIIALRAMNTGDDAEPKGILRQEAWYKTYKDKEDAYFKEQAKRGFTEGDLVQSPRVKQYYKLQGQNPSIEENTAKTHPLVNQYYKSGPDGSDARKAFYKANADKLSAEFGNLAEQKWAWTNEMRNLEGATPISWKDFQNSSYGFEPDEAKLASQLYFKNGGYGGKSGYTKFRSTSDQPTQYKLYLDQLLANDKNAKPISSLKIDTTPAKVKMKSFAPKAAKIKRIRIK